MEFSTICRCFVLVFGILQFTSANKLPPYIKACKGDAKINDCSLKNGRAALPKLIGGDPKYKIPRLDPFDITEIKINHGSKQIGLKLEMNNVKLLGLKTANFLGSRIDLAKKHIEWDLFAPKVQILGHYKADGKILILPITGDGQGNLTLVNVNLTYSFDYVLDKKNGKEFINIKEARIKFDTTRLYFKLENLFNGDKVLGDNMNAFLDENWKEVLDELGQPIVDSLAEIFTLIINNIAKDVPYNEVFL